MVVPFLAIFGLSYFFVEFGPNMTTFVLPSEVFPVSMRTTGHGIAAGIGKLGAFLGVFLVPQFQKAYGLRGMLMIAGIAAILGFALTRILPEPARQTLEDLDNEFDRPKASSASKTLDDDRSPVSMMMRQGPGPGVDIPGSPPMASEQPFSDAV
jgi:hypothetical protein